MGPDSARPSPAYRVVVGCSSPVVHWWGRLAVEGLEHLPAEGPVLLAGNHDSYWDPLTVGAAALPRRQIQALAKSSLWKIRGLDHVLNGMGQIPIDRGKADQGALARAVEELRGGACIGIFPEGTRSLGRELRARSGIGRLAEAVPEAGIVCVAVSGTVDIARFPQRPSIRVRFFLPAGGGPAPGEDPPAFASRLLAEIRAGAPIAAAGRRPKATR
jgi:1-acyl-sn-glycerol-3-phosphate acyltransferase